MIAALYALAVGLMVLAGVGFVGGLVLRGLLLLAAAVVLGGASVLKRRAQ